MKILILCFLIFNLNAFANYMSEVDMFDCSKISREIYTKLKTCQKNHADCMPLSHCETTSRQDTQVDDFDSPKFSKSEIEACADQAACETLNASKTCIDSEETVLMAQDYSDIYCSKQIGYNQKTVQMIREDAAKKAIYNAAQAAKQAIIAARIADEAMLKGLLVSLKAGANLTAAQVRKLQILFIEKFK